MTVLHPHPHDTHTDPNTDTHADPNTDEGQVPDPTVQYACRCFRDDHLADGTNQPGDDEEGCGYGIMGHYNACTLLYSYTCGDDKLYTEP